VIRICKDADIVFMALHGDCGENGKIQATFDLFDIKYTGTDALSSALAMDKFLTKQMFRTHGVKTPESFLLKSPDDPRVPEFPCVVKICSGGSSIGVYITRDQEEYNEALQKAFRYEGKVLVEQYIEGRELTDCVIEGEALPIVEIVPLTGFYDYKNKYQAGSTNEICPAQISESATKKIQEMAIKAYHALGIQTYARMDFIMTEDEEVYCLEANTLPGMTPLSLVPQEAAAIGKSFNDLCEWILEISLKKYA
jgi:D-alanine-D-alanine ligase